MPAVAKVLLSIPAVKPDGFVAPMQPADKHRPKTKLIACYAVGKRTGKLTRRFMLDVASRIVLPKSHDSIARAFQPESQLSS
jgi:hypothetical protein